MNVVSFYAPRPEHPFFQDYLPYLKVLDQSCKRFGHKHIVLTDAEHLGDLATFHVELPRPLMPAFLEAQRAYLSSPWANENTILVGADCVLAQDPEPIFADKAFDLAVTTHPFQDCILNTGAIFVRGGSPVAQLWERALLCCGEEWGDDQKALAAVINPSLKHGSHQRHGLTVEFLPVDPWNLAPDHPGHDCSHAVILHFRGPRKGWMVDYCAKRLGIGEPVQLVVTVNEPDGVIFDNIRANSLLAVPWLAEVPAHERHAVICGGGPSLSEMVEPIRTRQQAGHPVFALNAVADWLFDRGIVADYHVVIDARPDNLRFVERGSAKRYLLSSQVNPLLFKLLADKDVTLFHPWIEGIYQALPENSLPLLVGGGITSGLTTLPLVYTLGYRELELFGYDSSDRDGEAHAYPQSESDAERRRIEVWHGSRKFTTSFAMLKQAEGFCILADKLADAGCTLAVHGDGLLPSLARQMMTGRVPETKETNHGTDI